MFERYYRELLTFLSGQLSDRSTAADLAQESYLRVYAAQQAGTVVSNPRALLYTTARHLLTDHHRRARVRAAPSAEAEGPLPSADETPGPAAYEPEAMLASQQSVQALVAMIDALPPRCREAFLLYKFEGLSYREIAQAMGIAQSTVEMHLRHAMDACWRCFDQLQGTGSSPAAPVTRPGRKPPAT